MGETLSGHKELYVHNCLFYHKYANVRRLLSAGNRYLPELITKGSFKK